MLLYQIDAFTTELFGGNPAAVIPLNKWLPDDLMQKIALENNLSDTVFFVPVKSDAAHYEIRWFTPTTEINLCGHATLASAYVIFNILEFKEEKLVFDSKSGLLTITREEELLTMDFPSWKPERTLDYEVALLSEILGTAEIVGVYRHRDLLVEFADENAVKTCNPDFTLMKKHFDKVIITAPGNEADFVSRFFAPGVGVDEDPVTGSAHAQLIPFWSEKLHKKKLFAKQLSYRGGSLWCTLKNNSRVTISGKCVFYMKGEIMISEYV